MKWFLWSGLFAAACIGGRYLEHGHLGVGIEVFLVLAAILAWIFRKCVG
jgi:membrane protein implicated in regulation of membrane protease activity